MILHTASEGITLAKKLESESAAFYEELARKFPKNVDLFFTYAKENKKFIIQTERAYYGVITDALEGSYAFTTLDSDHYVLGKKITEGDKQADCIKQALIIEETIIKFYKEAAEQSRSLLADVPRTFLLIVKRREQRMISLQSMSKSN